MKRNMIRFGNTQDKGEQHRFVKCMQSGPRDVSFTSEGTAKGQFLSCNYLKLTSNL